VARTSVAAPPPRIVAPAPDSVLAVGPDIPREAQLVRFAMRPWRPTARWFLNGKPLSAEEQARWPIAPGIFQLRLADRNGQHYDEINFTVRATPPAAVQVAK